VFVRPRMLGRHRVGTNKKTLADEAKAGSGACLGQHAHPQSLQERVRAGPVLATAVTRVLLDRSWVHRLESMDQALKLEIPEEVQTRR
jgi:hypothetical protein